VQLTVEIQNSLPRQAPFKDFKAKLYGDPDFQSKAKVLKDEVTAFARRFPIPGLRYL